MPQAAIANIDFSTWKAEAISLLEELPSWSEKAVESIDWKAWEDYFMAGLTPSEAIEEEVYSAGAD